MILWLYFAIAVTFLASVFCLAATILWGGSTFMTVLAQINAFLLGSNIATWVLLNRVRKSPDWVRAVRGEEL